jgi:hypothetical protein
MFSLSEHNCYCSQKTAQRNLRDLQKIKICNQEELFNFMKKTTDAKKIRERAANAVVQLWFTKTTPSFGQTCARDF